MPIFLEFDQLGAEAYTPLTKINTPNRKIMRFILSASNCNSQRCSSDATHLSLSIQNFQQEQIICVRSSLSSWKNKHWQIQSTSSLQRLCPRKFYVEFCTRIPSLLENYWHRRKSQSTDYMRKKFLLKIRWETSIALKIYKTK